MKKSDTDGTLVARIHAYCGYWERCITHARRMDVKSYSRWMSALIYARVIDKWTLQRIGELYDVSPERVRQIVARFNRWKPATYSSVMSDNNEKE